MITTTFTTSRLVGRNIYAKGVSLQIQNAKHPVVDAQKLG